MGRRRKEKEEEEKRLRRNRTFKIVGIVGGLVIIAGGLSLFSGKRNHDPTKEKENSQAIIQREKYDLVKEQIFPESDLYVLYVPDIHHEECIQKNLQYIGRILRSDKIDIIGLEGLIGSVNLETVKHFDQKRLSDYQFMNGMHSQLESMLGKGKLVELYCYALSKRKLPPGYMYAKELLTTDLNLFGVDDAQLQKRSDLIATVNYATMANERIKPLLKVDVTTPEHKRILSQMQQDLIDKFGASLGKLTLGTEEEKQIVINQRNKVAIDNLVSEMRARNLKKGLLIYGQSHQEGLIEDLEKRRISYGILNNGITADHPLLKNRFGRKR